MIILNRPQRNECFDSILLIKASGTHDFNHGQSWTKHPNFNGLGFISGKITVRFLMSGNHLTGNAWIKSFH